MTDEIEVLLSHKEWVVVATAVRNSVTIHQNCEHCWEKRGEADKINNLLDEALATHNGKHTILESR